MEIEIYRRLKISRVSVPRMPTLFRGSDILVVKSVANAAQYTHKNTNQNDPTEHGKF